MIRFILVLCGFIVIICSCNDNFNDPNPDYEEIIDLNEPTIELLSLAADSVYYGIDSLDIRINYRDDYLLDKITFDMAPTNIAGQTFKLSFTSTDTLFQLDTAYALPLGDTVELGILTTCTDYAGNIKAESFNIKVVQ